MRLSKTSKIILVMLVIFTSSMSLAGCSKIINGGETEETINGEDKGNIAKGEAVSKKILNSSGDTIKTRYNTPEGFKRVGLEGKSFGRYIREQELKPYDASNSSGGIYDSALDLEIEIDNPHQAAPMMLLRAEYLYSQERYNEISFKFESGLDAEYEKWSKGNRLDKQGGVVRWVEREGYSNKHEDLRNYMDAVFKYSDGLLLGEDLVEVDLANMSIGDMFIRGGGHGQVVMVADIAVHEETGEKIFMLMQGTILAEETMILLNPNDADISPWFSTDLADGLVTPEGKFVKSDLKRFKE